MLMDIGFEPASRMPSHAIAYAPYAFGVAMLTRGGDRRIRCLCAVSAARAHVSAVAPFPGPADCKSRPCLDQFLHALSGARCAAAKME